jgi:TPR repeat protein
MYYNGWYVTKDYNKAFALLKEAAEAKNNPSARAMRLLAACYRYGLGTSVDAEKDKYWLEKAAEKKDEKAMAVMGID